MAREKTTGSGAVGAKDAGFATAKDVRSFKQASRALTARVTKTQADAAAYLSSLKTKKAK